MSKALGSNSELNKKNAVITADSSYPDIVAYNNAAFKQLTSEQVDTYKKNFKKLNSSGNGFLSFFEITQMLEKCGESRTAAEIKDMIKEVDTDNDGSISFPEFLQMMVGPPQVAGQPKKEISLMGKIAQSKLGDKAIFFEQAALAQTPSLEDNKAAIKASYDQKKQADAIKKAAAAEEARRKEEEAAKQAESRSKLAARAAQFSQ